MDGQGAVVVETTLLRNVIGLLTLRSSAILDGRADRSWTTEVVSGAELTPPRSSSVSATIVVLSVDNRPSAQFR